VVFLGVDHLRFRPQHLDQQPFVLSVGAVSPMKGYDFLIQALSHLPGSIRPGLVVVGNAASQAEILFLKEMAGKASVHLEFRINIPDEEIIALYNQASAFVYSPVMEPFGLAPLEAMACGTPVVAVREGGMRESVKDGETGYLTDRVPELFADKLAGLLAHPETARQLGHNARLDIERFWTWDHAFVRFSRVLSESGLLKE
jgi:glycosyltransferase involved in cell wall biosynthesis